MPRQCPGTKRNLPLTPLDPFLWGYLENRVYQNTPRTPAALKCNINPILKEKLGLSQMIT